MAARTPGRARRRRLALAVSSGRRARAAPSQRVHVIDMTRLQKACKSTYLPAMRRIDRRHLLPGAAAFAAALLVALLGLNAGADQPDVQAAGGHRGAPAAGRERLPRPPGAARAGRGRSGMAGRVARPAATSHPGAHDPRPRGRHGRRLAADLEPLARRADDRGHQPDGLRRRHARQPRVRRGRRRGPAARAPRALPLCRREHRDPRRRRPGPAALQDRRARRREGRLHRRDDDRHALLPALRVRAPVPLDRPLRRRQPLRARAAAPGCPGDRRAGARGRVPGGRRAPPARWSTRRARWTTRSTS